VCNVFTVTGRVANVTLGNVETRLPFLSKYHLFHSRKIETLLMSARKAQPSLRLFLRTPQIFNSIM
jgi:hypothetical protein